MNLIRQLPPPVIAQVRTGLSLSTFPQALVALIANVFDSNPSNVTVELDVPSGFISVQDDGEGFGDLTLAGMRYCSSRFQLPQATAKQLLVSQQVSIGVTHPLI